MQHIDDIVETWVMNTNVTQYLLDNIEPEWLHVRLADKGRTIGEQFLHINNIRSMWIGKVYEKVDLKMDKKAAREKAQLKSGLEESGEKMAETMHHLFSQNKIKGFKPHPTAFFAQMIAHESHHRGQIMVTLTRNNLEISKSLNFGLWSWHSK